MSLDPLKIVMITPQWLRTTGGPSSHVKNLAEDLNRFGHDVRILTCDEGAGARRFSAKPPKRELDILRLLAEIKPDIIHIHGRMHYVVPALAYKRLFGHRCRLVFTFHTQPYVGDFLTLPGAQKQKRDYVGIRRLIAKYLIHRCDEVITCSHSLISNLNKHYGLDIQRYTVLYTGAELRPVEVTRRNAFVRTYNLEGRYPVLSTIGVFSHDWKVAGHQVCIEAVTLLKDEYPGVRLLIVGEGEYRPYVEELVRERKLEAYVSLLGHVDSIGAVLAASDIYVHMAMHESQGLAVVEAMLAKRPVIVANRGGIPEIVEHGVTGLVIEPNAEELSSSVSWLVQHDAEREEMASAAFSYASRTLTKEYFARQNVRLYKNDR